MGSNPTKIRDRCNGKHGVHNFLIRDLFVILEVF